MPTEDWDIEDIDMIEPERFETILTKKQKPCGPTGATKRDCKSPVQ